MITHLMDSDCVLTKAVIRTGRSSVEKMRRFSGAEGASRCELERDRPCRGGMRGDGVRGEDRASAECVARWAEIDTVIRRCNQYYKHTSLWSINTKAL